MLQLLYKVCNISYIYLTLKKYMVHFCSYIYNCNYTKNQYIFNIKTINVFNILFLCRLNFNEITKYQQNITEVFLMVQEPTQYFLSGCYYYLVVLLCFISRERVS